MAIITNRFVKAKTLKLGTECLMNLNTESEVIWYEAIQRLKRDFNLSCHLPYDLSTRQAYIKKEPHLTQAYKVLYETPFL